RASRLRVSDCPPGLSLDEIPSNYWSDGGLCQAQAETRAALSKLAKSLKIVIVLRAIGRNKMLANLAVVLFTTTLAATPCANLKSISLPNTTITLAESLPAGTFTPPAAAAPPAAEGARGAGQRGGQPAVLSVPAFCRVAATLRPSSDSEINMEVWLPENWNQKFQFVGGGGWAGVISYPAMATAL